MDKSQHMTDEEMMSAALKLATEAHKGQVDKAGSPYIVHPVGVAKIVTSKIEKTVALLHDVVEDTYLTLDDLRREGFTEEVVIAVMLLTKIRDENFNIYRYLRDLKLNEIARAVKIADLSDNMDISRIPDPTDKDHKRVEKYKKQREFLMD